ncbi:DUF3307 domain-containing protein [Methylocystis bryophila]|uniref:DUF3307 domain-containing protein n=1 Tax=Methylocystis bryophila TaxID=655015 RepID=A0A1W6MTK1_9HYPH|nr:DUF3307 domain-containing protein [Methylocystis bryophila]ARN80819.1 hypothetical protein B1812_06730 [Methylocystis bryophila]BDV40906.1 hypothetical protein DSM21852_41590 [Methylocystis bryophila]
MLALPPLLSTRWLIIGLSAFLAKQLVGDFLLQNQWMAFGKERTKGWIAPLLAHAGIHAALTTITFALLAPSLAWLGVIDFFVHCAIDRAKGLIGRRFGLTPENSHFWWLLGFDQVLHHATHAAFVVILAAYYSAPELS